MASKPEFKFCAFFTVWESEFSLQWRCIKNSVVNGLLLYNVVCAAILCMTSGPTTLDHCTCSNIVLFSGIIHVDSVRDEDSQVIYSKFNYIVLHERGQCTYQGCLLCRDGPCSVTTSQHNRHDDGTTSCRTLSLL